MKSHVCLSAGRALRKHFSRGRKRAPARARTPYLVFIAYGDVPAARHAMNRLNQYLRRDGNHSQLQPMLWRFDQLDDPRWREMALRDAGRAATLVLAMSHASTFGPDAEAWLTALTVQQRGATLSALAFIGDDDAWTISLQQTKARPAPPAHEHEQARTQAAPLILAALSEQATADCAA